MPPYVAPTIASVVSFPEWNSHTWDFGAMLQDLITWYGASIGTGIFGTSMFVGIVLLIIFGVQAVRQESLLLPGAALATIGVSTELYGAVPLNMQAFFLMVFVVLPVVAVIYDIYRKR
jgi:hypothetical protein